LNQRAAPIALKPPGFNLGAYNTVKTRNQTFLVSNATCAATTRRTRTASCATFCSPGSWRRGSPPRALPSRATRSPQAGVCAHVCLRRCKCDVFAMTTTTFIYWFCSASFNNNFDSQTSTSLLQPQLFLRNHHRSALRITVMSFLRALVRTDGRYAEGSFPPRGCSATKPRWRRCSSGWGGAR
jgi:hypothetical protein